MIQFLQNLIDALSLGSIYALVALGVGLLFGILRLINFAHGDFITIGAYALIVPSADVTARLLDRRLALASDDPADLPDRRHRRPADRRAGVSAAAARLLADADDRLLRRQLHHPERHSDGLRRPPQGGGPVERRQHAGSDRRPAGADAAAHHARRDTGADGRACRCSSSRRPMACRCARRRRISAWRSISACAAIS